MQKLKSITALALCLLVVMGSLTGCGGKPANLPEAAYEHGLDALQAIDDYIDYKIDNTEALRAITDAMDGVSDIMGQSVDRGKPSETAECSVLLTNIMKMMTRMPTGSQELGRTGYNELVEARNEFAAYLGK